MRRCFRTATIVAGVALVVNTTHTPGAQAQQTADSLARRTQRTLDSLANALRATQARLDSVAVVASSAPAAAAPQRASGSYMNMSFDGLGDFGWSTQKDVHTLQRGDHDPKVRGFSIPNGEVALDGTIDPYMKGFSNIVLKLDQNGETGVELEEMYLLTTSLPYNLQIKAGQFFTEFGRQNPQHPHAWAFADQPLVLNRMFGGEGLRSQGARISWLLPTSMFTEAMLTVANSAGGTAYSFRSPESSEIHGGAALESDVNGIRDLLISPHISTSFDPTGTQTVLLGVSGAFGPNNSGPKSQTQIYGVDAYWKWKSPTASQGFPFVSMQTEALVRNYSAAERADNSVTRVLLPKQDIKDNGVYAQLLWGFKPLMVAGLRGDYVSGDQVYNTDQHADRYRVSPNLTWYPSEFSKLRAQYNYDHRAGIGNDHSFWIQFEFMMGAHSAHKF